MKVYIEHPYASESGITVKKDLSNYVVKFEGKENVLSITLEELFNELAELINTKKQEENRQSDEQGY